MDDKNTIKGQGLVELNHSRLIQAPDTYMQQFTNQWLDFVMTTDITDDNQIKNLLDALCQFGQNEQHGFWELNNRLKHPLEKLIRDAEGGGKVTQWLHELQVTVLKIKPPKQSFFSGFMTMFKLLFSLKESAWEMWLEDYPSYKKRILKVTKQLESHKRQLNRDNSLFLNNKNALDSQMQMLESSFDVGSYFEKTVSHASEHNQKMSTKIRQLLVDELLPAIQQRLIELQQQLLIARQSIMTMDLFIRQNESQIRGIDQAVNTTTAAIEVTANIYMLKQTGELIEKSNNPVNINKLPIKGTVDTQRLKQARHLIDQALSDMEKAKAEPSNVKNSTDSNKK